MYNKDRVKLTILKYVIKLCIRIICNFRTKECKKYILFIKLKYIKIVRQIIIEYYADMSTN